ncbi:MAG: cardiolipin synthase [Planctomycetaceae bacterium]|jgi:cardiolipin synthase A/B|nr:cardiolipin synthase [Planctomycetaceae bacterium]
MTFEWGLFITALGYLATLVLIPFVLLTPKRHSVSSVVWILTILTIPIFGGLLFLLFGINRLTRHAEQKRRATAQLHRLLPELHASTHTVSADDPPLYRHLMKLSNRLTKQRPMNGNRVEVLSDTNRTFGLIQEAIRDAKETIHLEYYIWQPDQTGIQLRDLLIKKAKEGIRVRFLYDGVGSWWLGKRFLTPMIEAGIEVAGFLPGSSFRERWSLNLRNHRKIIVVDGKIGFTGGMNIGDEYLGRDPQVGFWRDTHLRIEGACVLQLQAIFSEDWYYATGVELTDESLFPKPHAEGNTLAQVLAGEPRGAQDIFYTLLFSAITAANESVTLTTSYFVPPVALAVALETAALSGVKVRLLLPRRSAHQWTVWAARSYYRSLLEAGVRIYEYTRGQLHPKTIVVDGIWSLVGTPNIDTRSLELNFEVAVAAYDRRICDVLEHEFEQDLEWAEEIFLTEWNERSRGTRLVQNFCRLFAPVM